VYGNCCRIVVDSRLSSRLGPALSRSNIGTSPAQIRRRRCVETAVITAAAPESVTIAAPKTTIAIAIVV